ncbi:MAG: GH3 auxin-responsive promoter family protein [Crocinitomicaceae bacterium]|nr:GH3 auxin-responsive promoter family protein [Crocinitomicaceae bacterium]
MIVGTILKGASSLAHKKSVKKSQLSEKRKNVAALQEEQLRKLLSKAKKTEFGSTYGFTKLVESDNIRNSFRENVPIFQYEFMYKKFWHKTLAGVEDVTWPGKIQNFALTSGTTNAASKRIPVSKQMIRGIKRTCLKQVLTLSDMKLPSAFYEKDVLCVGGSTDLKKVNKQYEGDLSGILTGKVPHWINPYTKPGKKIRAISNWDEKLNKIVESAPKWDVGIICGVPAWVHILINRILDHYKVESIFEIWPNLRIYIHGGVSFSPYVNTFNQLFDKKVTYLDTYLASEGFIGFQSPVSGEMQLVLDNSIYFEFIPFNEEHFDADGSLMNYSDALMIDEVETGVDYALLITTNSGAYRYLIGDTIQFTDVENAKFKITGRTKHFLSLCGEHLSVDNMTQAISELSYEQNISIDEFCVLGKQQANGKFMHRWFIASDHPINSLNFKHDLDAKLCSLNDDYITERKHALENIEIEVLPTKVFYNFLKLMDKYGSQHKFPRVLKGRLAEDWEKYIEILEDDNEKMMVYWQSGSISYR